MQRCRSLSPVPPPPVQNWRQHAKAPSASDRPALTAEERFPSLEELDKEFTSPSLGSLPTPSKRNTIGYSLSQQSSVLETARISSRGPGGVDDTHSSYSSNFDSVPGRSRFDGVRSQHVTGAAMRESKMGSTRQSTLLNDSRRGAGQEPSKNDFGLTSRPSLLRRNKSSSFMKTDTNLETIVSPTEPASIPPALPPRPDSSPRVEPHDWLTGAEDDLTTGSHSTPAPAEESPQPVLRESPRKRASYIERSPTIISRTFEAETAEVHYHEPASTEPEKPRQSDWLWNRPKSKAQDSEGDKRTEERPSTPTRSKAFPARTGTDNGLLGRLQLPPVDTTAARNITAPSPSGLTDNWSPIAPTPESPSRKSPASSGDEGPEDLRGYKPRGGTQEKIGERGKLDLEQPRDEGVKRRRPGKGRQSSVHDLVDLWGGGVSTHVTAGGEKDSTRPGPPASDNRRSIIVPAPPSKPIGLSNKPRASSPQLTSSSRTESALSSRFSEHSPTRQSQHRKLPSNTTKAMRSAVTVSPSMPTSPFGKGRPQSLFLSSGSHSLPGSQTPSSPPFTETSAPKSSQETLAPPSASWQAARAARRNSISDMVQHYEAIGEIKSSGPGPGPPPKPSGLVVKVKSSGSDNTLHSPSAAAQRFPQLSPRNSPVLSKASLPVPEERTGATRPDYAKNPVSRTSPVLRVSRRDSASPSKVFPQESTANRISGLPFRTSPPEELKSSAQPQIITTATGTTMSAPLARISHVRKPTIPASTPSEGLSVPSSSSSDVRSPSPEKPFEGVSKLIDRWNRAVDEQGTLTDTGASGKRSIPAVRRAGVVGSESGRGR